MYGLLKDEVSYHYFGLFWLQGKGGWGLREWGGWKRLTRKRRRGCRSRWWGTGSGRRLPSAGPSSPVRRSRTCFYRAASPIFAPSVWSSPPTCCPLVWNQSRSGLMLKSPPLLLALGRSSPTAVGQRGARSFGPQTSGSLTDGRYFWDEEVTVERRGWGALFAVT